MKKNYKDTMTASFVGYVVQAIVNNFIPLLFVMLQNTYNIPLSQITLLITVNFAIQLVVDLLSTKFIDKIGYRTAVVMAHVLSAAGLICLTILPELTPIPIIGIIMSVLIYASGGGLLEVLISPIIEACPTKNKERAMSLLHSFYCWGQVGVVLVSTAFFAIFGIKNWKIMAILWAVIPIINGINFTKVPIYTLAAENGETSSIRDLLKMRIFWIFLIMMTCAGASELTVSQWSSAFAEEGLGISKTLGDLMGPMAFAATMGASRLLFGKYGDKWDLNKFIEFSSVLCIASYLAISLISSPIAGLVGCAVCGFSVGIFWPGTYSKASAEIKSGGTAMFAILALAGDLGCTAGPTLAGFVSDACGNNLRAGILSAVVFPIIMLFAMFFIKKQKN